MMQLSELEYDALTECFNIALGSASTSFSEIVRTEVHMSVPSVEILAHDQLIDRLGYLPDSSSQRRLVAIAQEFASSHRVETDAVLLMPQQASLEVVRRMLGDMASGVQDITELEQDALGEIGNVIINSCMASLAELFGLEFQGSLPKVESAELDTLLTQFRPTDATLLAKISMTLRASNVSGMVLFLMSVPSLEILLKQMREQVLGAMAAADGPVASVG